MVPSAMAVALRAGLPVDASARLVLHDGWTRARDGGLDRFHWVNEGGTSTLANLPSSRLQCGDAAGEPEMQQAAGI